jgi:hypothetical protein
MFNSLATIAIVTSAAIAVLLAYAATRPKTFRVARSASITAPPENIFPLINDLRRMNSWNPFLKTDPAIRLTYSGPGHGKGAANEWAGSGQAGKGRPVLMSPQQSALSLPCAGEMPGSAAQTDARTRSRKRTRDTSSRPECFAAHSRRDRAYHHTLDTPMPYIEPVYTGGAHQGPAR